MDVVRTNVEKVGGTVDIETRRGQGTSIKIKIPLTLAIIPALIVGCGAARYAIPQATVLEIVRLGGEHDKPQIEDIQGAPVFRRRGRLLPLAFLRRELDLRDGYAEARDSGVIVVLEADDRSFGLVVDEILDTDEIVVKPIWKRLKSLSCYAGATVMGDGKVALVLDSIGLARKVGVVSEIRQRAVAHAAPAEAGEREEELVVLCRLGTEGHLAIPLSCVTRLEDLPRSRIERVGGANVAQYRGEILPLVEASRVLEERRKHPRHSGDARSSAQAGSAQVVVFAHKGRRLGLIVDAILDVVGVRIALQRQACRAGILGSMVVRDRVTEFLDVDYVIRAAAPSAISESVALGDA
jgi:two-component system chemotaxis sensor kinase CheA